MRTIYEDRLGARLRADRINHEPRILCEAPAHVPKNRAFKTPDILTSGPDAIIECTELLPSAEHATRGLHHACGPEAQCSRLYEKIADKAARYSQIARTLELPYVIAVNNLSCASGHQGAAEVLYGNCLECLLSAGFCSPETGHMWETTGLFELPSVTHVSAVLHENDAGSLLIPNPNTIVPVPEALFPFAETAKANSPVWTGEFDLRASDQANAGSTGAAMNRPTSTTDDKAEPQGR